MTLHLPDELIAALHLTESELREELAIALYASGRLSFGQARRLAGLDWVRFRHLLAERNIPAHYDREDLEADMAALEHFPGV